MGGEGWNAIAVRNASEEDSLSRIHLDDDTDNSSLAAQMINDFACPFDLRRVCQVGACTRVSLSRMPSFLPPFRQVSLYLVRYVAVSC